MILNREWETLKLVCDILRELFQRFIITKYKLCRGRDVRCEKFLNSSVKRPKSAGFPHSPHCKSLIYGAGHKNSLIFAKFVLKLGFFLQGSAQVGIPPGALGQDIDASFTPLHIQRHGDTSGASLGAKMLILGKRCWWQISLLGFTPFLRPCASSGSVTLNGKCHNWNKIWIKS